MSSVHVFAYSPFQQNTSIIDGGDGTCAIVDPGCYQQTEQSDLVMQINRLALKPSMLLNTHAHIDHVFGNRFVHEKWKLPLHLHVKDIPTLHSAPMAAMLYGLSYDKSPEPEVWLSHGDVLKVGVLELQVLFAPGHAPGHVVFYCEREGWVVGGDVLFRESIGRTDLPGGDHEQLLESIRSVMYQLPDNTIVYPGHGPATTIGHEKKHNPFVRG